MDGGVKISAYDDGPFLVTGAVEITDAAGNSFSVRKSRAGSQPVYPPRAGSSGRRADPSLSVQTEYALVVEGSLRGLAGTVDPGTHGRVAVTIFGRVGGAKTRGLQNTPRVRDEFGGSSRRESERGEVPHLAAGAGLFLVIEMEVYVQDF